MMYTVTEKITLWPTLHSLTFWEVTVDTHTDRQTDRHTILLVFVHKQSLKFIPTKIYRLFIPNFRRVLKIVFFLLGYSPASEFYVPTFRNTLSVPDDETECFETSAYTIQRPGNHPKERIQNIDSFTTKGGKPDNRSNELPLQLATCLQYDIHIPPLLCWEVSP